MIVSESDGLTQSTLSSLISVTKVNNLILILNLFAN